MSNELKWRSIFESLKIDRQSTDNNAPRSDLRALFRCFGIVCGFCGMDYTSFVKRSQKVSFEQVLLDGVPEWVGASNRVAAADHAG